MRRAAWNDERRRRIQERLRTVDVCVTGYWFCLGCQQISEPESVQRFNCAICGSPRLRHHLPIMSPAEAALSQQQDKISRRGDVAGTTRLASSSLVIANRTAPEFLGLQERSHAW